jgi:hypothetical protein
MGGTTDEKRRELGDDRIKSVDDDLRDGTGGCGRGIAFDPGRI